MYALTSFNKLRFITSQSLLSPFKTLSINLVTLHKEHNLINTKELSFIMVNLKARIYTIQKWQNSDSRLVPIGKVPIDIGSGCIVVYIIS